MADHEHVQLPDAADYPDCEVCGEGLTTRVQFFDLRILTFDDGSVWVELTEPGALPGRHQVLSAYSPARVSAALESLAQAWRRKMEDDDED
jgi:hypothetical protein